MRTNFLLDEHLVRPGFDKDRRIAVRIGNHQMYVELELGDLPYRLHHWRPESQVRHEMSVHHIDVQDACARLFDSRDFLAEPRKVRGQYRWEYFNHLAGLLSC